MLAASFILITLLALMLFYVGTGKDKVVLAIALVWITLVGGIAATGYFQNTDARPPRFMFLLFFTIVLVFFTYRKLRSKPINIQLLITIHALRLPVELILYQLFLDKQIPVLMTFRGWNFDLFMGVSAIILLLVLLFVKDTIPRFVLIAWNISGILLLTTIVIIAILSSPLPIQQWAFEQPNRAVLAFPYVLLPAFVVPVVFLSHFLLLKKLFSAN